MKKQYPCLLLVFLLFNLAQSCKKEKSKVVNAFYFWRSNTYSLTEKELSTIDQLQIQKLYVKFFEVEPNVVLGAIPVAKTKLNIYNTQQGDKGAGRQPQIIPTIYIRNDVLYHITATGLDSLAGNIFFLIDKYYNNQMNAGQLDYKEIQLDCDWTEKTKDNYFYLLRKVKEVSKRNISCTLRLYPYKYSKQMGIPPVDKAVLMCYNLLSPLASESANSILSPGELEKYLVGAAPYPLHLDIALPVFSWMQVYQNNRFAGLVSTNPHELEPILKPVKPLWYEVTGDCELENLFLRAGDKVKFEEITAKTLEESIALLNKYLPGDDEKTVILFQLDSNNLDQFDHETLHSFFTCFTK